VLCFVSKLIIVMGIIEFYHLDLAAGEKKINFHINITSHTKFVNGCSRTIYLLTEFCTFTLRISAKINNEKNI